MPSDRTARVAPALMTSAETAKCLSVSTATLSRWRSQHLGPPYISLCGMPRYRKSDLDAFVEENVR